MKSSNHYRPALAVLVGGGIAATLDLTYAILRNWGGGMPPIRTLHSVASGWLGKASYESGLVGGALGFVSHYAIVFVAATLYLAASKRAALLRDRPLVCGSIFGVLVYLFMNLVVMPLTAVPFKLTYTASRLAEGFAVHAVFVGIPIALAVYYWTSASNARNGSAS